MELQEQVVDRIARLRNGKVDIRWPMSPAQREAHRRYGYPNVGAEAWDIHFTYGFIPQPADPLLQGIRTGIEMSQPWTAEAIAIVCIGENGTACEILHQRDLTPLARPTT